MSRVDMGNGKTPIPLPIASGSATLDSGLANIIPTRKRHIHEPGYDGLFNMQDGPMSKKARVIQDPGVGERISPFTGTSPLDGMRTGLFRKPNLHTSLPTPMRQVNQRKAYTRIVMRPPDGSRVLDTVSKGRFGFLYRPKPGSEDTPMGRALREVVRLPMGADGSEMEVDITPRVVLDAAVLNSFLLQIQVKLLEENPEAFERMTASDIMSEWSFDGLVISEEMLNGAESARTSGFANHGKWFGGDGNKVVTLVMGGEDLCHNVFGNQVAHGSALGFVVKKFNINKKGLAFNLDAKGFNPALAAVSTDLNTLIAQERVIRSGSTNPNRAIAGGSSASKIFKPYLIAYWANIDGAILPLEYRRFRDERGVVRYDSYCQHIGHCLIAPEGLVSQSLPVEHIRLPVDEGRYDSDWLVDDDPDETSTNTEALPHRPGAAVDASLGADQPLIKIYMNPRGVNPLA